MKVDGFQWGWWGGGLGSLLWLPIMSVVWLTQGNAGGAVLALLVTAAGVAYLLFLPPWRFPNTPVRRLYLGFLAILFAGAAVAVWQYRQSLTASQCAPLLALFACFTPVFVFGRKSWSDLHRRGE